MNAPAWFAEWLARPIVPEPPDPSPQPLGGALQATPLPAGLAVSLDRGAVQVGFLSDDVIEVRVAATGDVEMPSFARVAGADYALPGAISLEEGESGWSIGSAAARVEVARSPLRLTVRGSDGEVLLAEDAALGTAQTRRGWRVHWRLGDADRVYGLGAKVGALDRRGRRTMLWNRDMVVGQHTDPTYSSVPLLILARGSRCVGVLLDSAARTVFDVGCTAASRLACGPRRGALVYVVFTGPTLADVMRQYTALSGRAPLPPLWSLGHHQSRWSYNDADEVREIAGEFRRRDIPNDVIHLDIHAMRGFRVFTFDAERFPQPAQLAADLAAEGMRAVAIVDPGVKTDRRYEVFRDGVARGFFATAATDGCSP